jgi:hypothetical protein
MPGGGDQFAPRAVSGAGPLATDDPLHGEQEGRFFNAYYDPLLSG